MTKDNAVAVTISALSDAQEHALNARVMVSAQFLKSRLLARRTTTDRASADVSSGP
jgi:hypothetical protein